MNVFRPRPCASRRRRRGVRPGHALRGEGSAEEPFEPPDGLGAVQRRFASSFMTRSARDRIRPAHAAETPRRFEKITPPQIAE